MTSLNQTKPNYVVNNRREPIYRNIKTECCPTCKEPLSFDDAINGSTKCKCGEWWYNLPSPYKTTASDDDGGWHFKENL